MDEGKSMQIKALQSTFMYLLSLFFWFLEREQAESLLANGKDEWAKFLGKICLFLTSHFAYWHLINFIDFSGDRLFLFPVTATHG